MTGIPTSVVQWTYPTSDDLLEVEPYSTKYYGDINANNGDFMI